MYMYNEECEKNPFKTVLKICFLSHSLYSSLNPLPLTDPSLWKPMVTTFPIETTSTGSITNSHTGSRRLSNESWSMKPSKIWKKRIKLKTRSCSSWTVHVASWTVVSYPESVVLTHLALLDLSVEHSHVDLLALLRVQHPQAVQVLWIVVWIVWRCDVFNVFSNVPLLIAARDWKVRNEKQWRQL